MAAAVATVSDPDLHLYRLVASGGLAGLVAAAGADLDGAEGRAMAEARNPDLRHGAGAFDRLLQSAGGQSVYAASMKQKIVESRSVRTIGH